jgi:phosphoribosylanthranilate isomerase
MTLKLKICGLKNEQNIKEVIAEKPDYIGFIFYDLSKRYVGNNITEKLIESIPQAIKKTGVFVNQSIDYVLDTVSQYSLNAVQLHGFESPQYCSLLRSQLDGVEIVKAFGLNELFDFKETSAYITSCNYFLFDTKVIDFGGSGKQFNWDILSNYDNVVPYFLSGGIGDTDIEKVKTLKKQGYNIYAVDINSKAEIEPGLKDISIVKNIKHKLAE